MKNYDVFSKRLLAITLSICAILLSAGFFIFSISSSRAGQNTAVQVPQTVAGGKYMMQFIVWKVENETIRQILVWDTETGYSKRYYLSTDSWMPTDIQLPEKPL